MNKLIIFLAFISYGVYPAFQAEQYNATNVKQFQSGVAELHKLGCMGTEKILDIGSGDGRLSSYIAEKYIPHGQLIGIDKDAGMVAFATFKEYCAIIKTTRQSAVMLWDWYAAISSPNMAFIRCVKMASI